MIIASATADSAALTPIEKSVKNIPSYPFGKSILLKAAKFISTLLRINSITPCNESKDAYKK